MNVKKCSVCNVEIEEDICKKDGNICKECYNINEKHIIITKRKENMMTL